MHRHFHVQLLVGVNALEVDVLDQLFERVICIAAAFLDSLALPSVMVRIELWKSSFLRAPQGVVIEFDQFRQLRHHRRCPALWPCCEAAARTTALCGRANAVNSVAML